MKYFGWLIVLVMISCSQEKDDMERGKEIAQRSFEALSKELQSAMSEEGPMAAVQYCHVNALPLTQELSEQEDVVIRRTALKYRNEANKPDSLEHKVLVEYSKKLLNNEKLEPMIIQVNGSKRFFSPIMTKPICLTCHGMPGTQIEDDLFSTINDKYPNDMAVGFQEGDLRGIWSITMNK